MALAPRIEIRQSQSLVMTPQLMQAIKLLQMSNLDLEAYVSEELERNPLLERTDGDADALAPTPASAEASGSDGGSMDEPQSANNDGSQVDERPADAEWVDTEVGGDKAIADALDADAKDVFSEDGPSVEPASDGLDAGRLAGDSWADVGAGGQSSADPYDMEANTAADVSLNDHLTDQLSVASQDGLIRSVAGAIIGSLDEIGYLREETTAIAERLGVEVMVVDAALQVVQGMDPSGVGARSLAECLELQLRDRNRFDPAIKALLENLDLLARGDRTKLRQLCGVDDEDLNDMVLELRRLDPKPGLAFGGTPAQTVVPDVLVRARADGGWSVELNTDTLPKVLIDRTYFATVSKSANRAEDKAYLSDCLQTANWLIKSLDQRATTILKVSSEIVRQQDGFLTYGVSHLKPLTLRAVADVIGMHESTVSRVTANKYMATPRGIFELKYFFTASIASADGGDAHSAEAVRYRIKQLIDAEEPGDILSDDTIVKLLKEAGIDVARRTVAKYREAMRIPSSVQRRREKKALLRA